MTRFGRTMVMVAGWCLGLAASGARSLAGAGAPPRRWPARRWIRTGPRPRRPQNKIDIAHHIGNAHEIELPFGACGICRGSSRSTSAALALDLSPTRHLVFMVLAAVLVALVFVLSARSRRAGPGGQGRPAKGFAGAMEATALYIRQEVILPNVGHHGEGFVPYLLTLFFFILAMNLLGLLPWGATATGNIAVTGALALMAFVTIEVAGMRALGAKGYLSTIFYLPPGLPTIAQADHAAHHDAGRDHREAVASRSRWPSGSSPT